MVLGWEVSDVVFGEPPPDPSELGHYPFQLVLGSISKTLSIMAKVDGPQEKGSA